MRQFFTFQGKGKGINFEVLGIVGRILVCFRVLTVNLNWFWAVVVVEEVSEVNGIVDDFVKISCSDVKGIKRLQS